ncbi:unnamed protein product [Effrenium voratum]|uniref:Uncharacterized protein n=1 Tax=Effrenium voratum TaxID=2562239 RepID=A0AA36HXI5_9DINO|nr:unnamed protein product [Effrenium voratum]
MPIALPAVDVERRAKVIERLRQLWEQEEVPAWHRRLFEEKYCQGTYGSEFLIREVQALKSGTAPVQEVQKAIWHREEVLVRLTLLRTGFSDEEILTAGSLPRRHLAEQLQELRRAGARCVEALSAWRRSVAPLQVGCVPGWPYAGPTGEVDDATEDYLVHLADDAVVRAFETVVEVSPECDPFLLFRSGGTSWKESGKLCPPAVADRARLERARLQLGEQEVALSRVPEPSAARDRAALLQSILKGRSRPATTDSKPRKDGLDGLGLDEALPQKLPRSVKRWKPPVKRGASRG